MKAKPQAPCVLVVDDTPANIGMLLEALPARGYAVTVAESGASALEQLGFRLPDLILLDVNMPGIDGFEVCRRLRANKAWRDLPVIFMTARDALEDKITAFRAGAVDYVTKPLEVDEVLARVGTHLELRQLRRSLQAKNAALEEEIAMRTEAEDALAGSLTDAVLVCDSEGRIRFATGLARDWVNFHFPARTDRRLPEALRAFLAEPVPAPVVTTEQGGRLRVDVLREVGSHGLALLYMESVADGPSPEQLAPLGLTPRQAEVLFWIAQGKTNPEIASLLDASVRTIHKHVENIFEKLGVENRQSAALRAHEHLHAPPSDDRR